MERWAWVMYGLDLPCFEGSAYSVAVVENLMGLVVVPGLGDTTCCGNGNRSQSTSEATR